MAYPLTGTARTSAVRTVAPANQRLASGPRTWEPLPTYERSSTVEVRQLALGTQAPTEQTLAPPFAGTQIEAVAPVPQIVFQAAPADVGASSGSGATTVSGLFRAAPAATTTASSAGPSVATSLPIPAASTAATAGGPSSSLPTALPAPAASVSAGSSTPVVLVGLHYDAPPTGVSAGLAAPKVAVLQSTVAATLLASSAPTVSPAAISWAIPAAGMLGTANGMRSVVLRISGISSAMYLGSAQGSLNLPSDLALTIEGTATLSSTPATLVVSLVGAQPGDAVNFAIDGTALTSVPAGPGGEVGPLSLEIPQLSSGTHVLSAGTSSQPAATASFTVTYDSGTLPAPAGLDAGPVEVLPPFEVRKWVLQDLSPGGLGSWSMPMNPRSMDPLPVSRSLDIRHATSSKGKFSISESQDLPQEWSFAGFCPDQAFYDQLVAYADLRCRFYVIDHRARALIVAPVGLEMVPRKRGLDDSGQYNDWRHDYTFKLVVYGQTELVTA